MRVHGGLLYKIEKKFDTINRLSKRRERDGKSEK